jgi:cytochrome c556
VDVNKFASRVAFLAGLLPEAFPDISRTGDTRATPEVWSNRADFNKRLKDFGDHAVALSRLVQGGGELDAFRNAARTVAQDCKGCHDTYRTK